MSTPALPRYRVLTYAANRDLAFNTANRCFTHRGGIREVSVIESDQVHNLIEEGLCEIGSLLFADTYAVVLSDSGRVVHESLAVI